MFHRLIDEAEVKEALLAYSFLLKEDKGISPKILDEKIEQWFLTHRDCSLNFEINDALNKLLELKLVRLNDGELMAEPLSHAIHSLDNRWDQYFSVKG